MVFPSAPLVCVYFLYPPEIGFFILPCRRWRILDAHALPPPVKPAKSRQIVANDTAESCTPDQARSAGGRRFSGDAGAYRFI